jgi:hypothetical protein
MTRASARRTSKTPALLATSDNQTERPKRQSSKRAYGTVETRDRADESKKEMMLRANKPSQAQS